MILFQKNVISRSACILLLFQFHAAIAFAAQDVIPKDLALEELHLKPTGDVIPDSRVVADPKTGRVWEIRKAGANDIQVVRTSKFKPWKPKKKLHKLAEILNSEPVKR